jgi:E3 ubiquitin-protein ligase DOA10
MNLPFLLLANRSITFTGDHLRDTPRNKIANPASASVDTKELRERMKMLLDIILEFVEKNQVEDEQTNIGEEETNEAEHTSTKHHFRQIPARAKGI